MSIHSIEMFKGLSNLELAQILGKLGKLSLPPGEVLFRQGDEGSCMYIIEKGMIELFASSPEGQDRLLTRIAAGDTLGEMALLTGEPRSATAMAADHAELFVIDLEMFQTLMEGKASISTYFIRLLSQRLIHTNTRLQESREAKLKQAADKLADLPEPLPEGLLVCSLMPLFSMDWIESACGIDSLQHQLAASAGLRGSLHPAGQTQGGALYSMEPGLRSVLSELFVEKYGYAKRKSMIASAGEYLARHHGLAAAAAVYAEAGEWPAILALVGSADAAAGQPAVGESLEAELCLLLDSCPDELLIADYRIFERYLKGCSEAGHAKGLARLETAFSRTHNYSVHQMASLYEYGAELCHRLDMKQKALEFLQMAETAAGSEQTLSGMAGQDRDRSYNLAKQRLDSRKSRQMADQAGGFWKQQRMTGLVALLLVIASLAYFHFAPPVAGLSRQGMDFIGIGIAAVILWIVNIIPDYLVALFMAMLWTVGGLVQPEVALSGFATPTWLYMFFILALGAVITKSGILYRLSLHALRLFPTHYRGQLWGIVAGGMLLNPMIPSSSAKVALGVPIARTLSELMGFRPQSRGAAGLGLAAMIFYGFTAPFILTGSYTNVMAYGLIPGAQQLSWFKWFLYALPAFIIFTAVMLLSIKTLFKNVEQPKAVSRKVLDDQLKVLGSFTREEKITMFTVLGSIGLLIAQPLHGIDNTWVMLLGFAVLVISGALDTKTLKSGIDWTFLLFIGVAFSFAQAARQLGIIEAMTLFLGDYMEPFLASPLLFLLAVIVLSFAVTLVVRDDPAVILLTISMLPLAGQAGIHPWVLVFVILLSTDPFLFAYQSPTYLTAYYSAEGKSFSHRQGQKIAVSYVIAVVLATVLCVPYWEWIGLIGR
ncbi:SLC13 family permease [Paenibacillus nasutitermitis]|uniref:Cyclic nucleotide-binding domain-containing protein n=1 Tax=Paenibacillus nasutitermitis TaxID=1652958 RepID=A0A917E1N6_9BACL|nr:SLC13 family permease [Paenibacillus nasutitermitis]GGD90184.1 hypothetical protein GCM10010911_56040 [Paenibacillus nasutitermitis]